MQSTQPFFACPDKGVNSGLPDADWEKLTQLFQAAVALEPQERSAFVDRNTVGDEELRRRLRGMLEHDSTAADRIACVIGELAGSAPLPNVWLGRRFGPYRAVREIGRGGMGLVLEAVRDDSEFEKTVAIKVAPWGHDPAGFVQRFRNERQILAALEHPHIAHFLDGGTEDGTPFLVMEYVNGVRITEFARGLDVRSRVRLFQQVCSAVQYAHENLVVHRDLKPDNILVTTNGQVKLLDFGVAKLLGNVDSHLTASGAKLWTPDYASPEQIRGRAVTVRADVYSLGLILYEMLTGERAQVADLRSPLALDASICDSEPTRPSARLSEKGDATLARQLSGDLDVIVGKALRKEPEQRYGSAAEFSEDLQRYLEGRPVHARSRRWDYRTRRFVARHRIAVAAGVLAIAMAAAGTVAIAREARRAERRFAQVRGLANAFVFEVHDRIETLPGATEARKAIVQTALKYLENLREEAEGDGALMRELAAAYGKIGAVRGHPLKSNLGDSKGALENYTQAVKLLENSALRDDEESQRLLASVYRDIGLIQRRQGEPQQALQSYTRSRNLAASVLERVPKSRETLQMMAELEGERGRALTELGDTDGAARAAEGAMRAARALTNLDPGDWGHRMGLSTAYTALATAQIGAGRIADAANSYRNAVGLREKLASERPNDVSIQRNLLIAYGGLGDVLGFRTGDNLGDTEGAMTALNRSISIAERLHRADPADRRAQFDLASAYMRLGAVMVDAGSMDAGVAKLEQAYRLLETLRAADSANTLFRYNSMFVDRRIGEALVTTERRRREGIAQLERAAAEAGALMNGAQAPGARLNRLLSQLKLAELRAEAGDAAAAALADVLAREVIQYPSLLKAPWNRATTYAALGRVYGRVGRSKDAAEWLEKSVTAWRQLQAPAGLEIRRRKELAKVEEQLADVRVGVDRRRNSAR